MDEYEIYAAHSFNGDVCFDDSILKMIQTSFGKDIEFSFRTFRFTGGQTSGDQEQSAVNFTWNQLLMSSTNKQVVVLVITLKIVQVNYFIDYFIDIFQPSRTQSHLNG